MTMDTENRPEAIPDCLEQARISLKKESYQDAETYADKVIALDDKNVDAWLLKGEAVGFQSDVPKSRMEEMVSCWLTAIQLAPADRLTAIRGDIGKNYFRVFWAFITRYADHFAEDPSEENKKAVIEQFHISQKHTNTLLIQGNVPLNLGIGYNMAAYYVTNRAIKAGKEAIDDYQKIGAVMPQVAWPLYESQATACIQLLGSLVEYTRSQELLIDNYTCDIALRKTIVASSQCNPFKKLGHEISIPLLQTSLLECAAGFGTLTKTALREGEQAEDTQRAFAQYWQEHAQEKEAYLKEKQEQEEKVASLHLQEKNLPFRKEIMDLQKQIHDLQNEQKKLRFFQGKQKKALQEQIDGLSKKLTEQQELEAEEKKELLAKRKYAEGRIEHIDHELTTPRGTLPAPDVPGMLAMEQPVKDRAFTFTPSAFAAYLQSILPEKETITLKDGVSPLPDFGKQYSLETAYTKERIRLFCAADSQSSAVKAILLSFCLCDGGYLGYKKNVVPSTILGTHVLAAICPSITKAEAENIILDMWYSKDNTIAIKDGVICRLALAEASSEEKVDDFPLTHGVIVITPLA